MSEYNIALVLGVFMGNWLVAPLFIKERTHKDGFYIGLIAAILCIVIFTIFDLFGIL